MKNILIVLACLVAGYVIVSMLTNTKADGRRPPPGRDEEPPPPEAGTPRALPPPALPPPRALPSSRALPSAHSSDWTLLLDIPRSANARDIEAAFRRQQGKAVAAGDQAMLEKLRLARDAALAEKKNS
jgi:hypothetical protein